VPRPAASRIELVAGNRCGKYRADQSFLSEPSFAVTSYLELAAALVLASRSDNVLPSSPLIELMLKRVP
jgi:hypothetical protein